MLTPKTLDSTKYKLSEKYKLMFTMFIFLAQFLGSIINLYNCIWWYDLFVHFLFGVVISFIGVQLLKVINKKQIKTNLSKFIYVIGLVVLLAVSWKIVEYFSDLLFKTNLQHSIETGVNDTMEDLIVAMIGGIVTYIILNKKARKLSDK